MPEIKQKCPSCGGTKLGPIIHNGRTYLQCLTPREKQFGTGKRVRLVTAPCGFWTTKETAWQPKTSS